MPSFTYFGGTPLLKKWWKKKKKKEEDDTSKPKVKNLPNNLQYNIETSINIKSILKEKKLDF